MKSYSESKRRILQQSSHSSPQDVPQSLKSMLQLTSDQFYQIGQKFKNLQDPLSYIHTNKIQSLIDSTNLTSKSLHRHMEEISEFSKSTYKQVVSRQNNEFDFDLLYEQVFKDNGARLRSIQLDLSKSKVKQQKQKNDIIKHGLTIGQVMEKKVNNQALQRKQNLNTEASIKSYKHINANQNNINQNNINQNNTESRSHNHNKLINQVSFNFDHMKILDTPAFNNNCKNVEFYDMLKSDKQQKYKLYNQQFDIDDNFMVNKHMAKVQMQLVPIQLHQVEQSSISNELFFDFQQNLKFWKQKTPLVVNGVNINDDEQNRRKSQQITLAFCSKIQKQSVGVNNICDFAMRKVTPTMLSSYFKLKNQLKTKMGVNKRDQNLQKNYNQLKREYQYSRQLRQKAKSQRIPIKFTDSQSQTMQKMQQNQFDDYFAQKSNQLLVKLGKLNNLRQRTMINSKANDKLIIIKNICLDIKQLLFKLLVMMLKGQKFYPTQSNMNKNRIMVPYFTYSDLLNINKRQQVENRILQLIYTKISQFQVQKVQQISKGQIIRIYAQQRQRNNKILQIIHVQ